jgi:hypothetical protein
MAQTLDEINREFEIKLKAAPDEQKIAMQLDWEKAKSAFWQEDSFRKEKVSWVTEALKAYPHARPGEISGDTKDAILASAKTSHEEIEKLVGAERERVGKEKDDEYARRGWGGPGGGPSGGGPTQGAPRAGVTVQEQFEKDVETGWDGLRQKTLTPQQGERLENARLGVIAEYVVQHMEEGRGGSKK